MGGKKAFTQRPGSGQSKTSFDVEDMTVILKYSEMAQPHLGRLPSPINPAFTFPTSSVTTIPNTPISDPQDQFPSFSSDFSKPIR